MDIKTFTKQKSDFLNYLFCNDSDKRDSVNFRSFLQSKLSRYLLLKFCEYFPLCHMTAFFHLIKSINTEPLTLDIFTTPFDAYNPHLPILSRNPGSDPS